MEIRPRDYGDDAVLIEATAIYASDILDCVGVERRRVEPDDTDAEPVEDLAMTRADPDDRRWVASHQEPSPAGDVVESAALAFPGDSALRAELSCQTAQRARFVAQEDARGERRERWWRQMPFGCSWLASSAARR